MHTLNLTIKKKWFDMIASGEKKEEYREIKPYYISRFQAWGNAFDQCRDFNVVKFRNGYSKSSLIITIECDGIVTGFGNPEWGAEAGKEYYIIKLGQIITP